MNRYRVFSSWYFFIFFSMGCFIPLISPFFSHRGFSGSEIGTALGAGAFITILAQPLWGIAADRIKNPRMIFLILTAAYSIAGLIILSLGDTLPITLAYILFMVFFSGVNPVTDSMVLGNHLEFGRVRLWGALGFAAGAQASGVTAQHLGLSSIFICILFSNIVVVLLTSRIQNPEYAHGERREFKFSHLQDLIMNRSYLIFLLASFLIGGTMVANNSYFGLLFQSLGGSLSGVGLAFLLFAGSEAPVMAVIQKIAGRLNLALALMVSSLLFSARYLFYGSMPSPRMILIFFFIQGLSIGSYLVLATLFIEKNTHSHMRASALGIYFSVSIGLGGMAAQYGSGYILQRYSISAVYNCYLVSSILGALLYLLLYLEGCRKTK